MAGIKKILFVANVHQHYYHFHIPYIQWLTEKGYEVHVAAGGNEQIPFAAQQFRLTIHRSPFHWKNIRAYAELKNLIRKNQYHLIHCHTPVGGVLARLAACSFRKKEELKVLYTAHGLYFYRGAPFLYWLLFYPVEKLLSLYTDALITINQEDFENAGRLNFKSKEIYRIPGIGFNNKFKPLSRKEKNQIRKELGYSDSQFILVYAAEFIHRKNHRFVLDALSQIIHQIPRLKIIFAGDGKTLGQTRIHAKKRGLLEYIDFVGFRTDIEKIIAISDVAISSSRMEGLPMNVAEAMACAIPVVVSKIRGHTDLVSHGVNGFLFEQNNKEAFTDYILELYRSPELREKIGKKAKETVEPFGINNVIIQMAEIYQKFMS